MKTRKMLLADLPKVVKMYKEANLFATLEDIKKWTQEGFEKFPELNLVHTDKDVVVGAISAVVLKDKTVEINDLVTVKKYRNKGIGTKLMNTLMDDCIKKGLKKFSLWVHWKNAQAIPFHYNCGFHISGFIKTKGISGVPDGEDIIVMERRV